MRKKIACFLHRIANKLGGESEHQKIAIGYKILWSDVKKYRKMHPEAGSLREAYKCLIEDVKNQAIISIAYAAKDRTEFDITKKIGYTELRAELHVYTEKDTGTE